jgi:Glycosyl hydrolase family 79 C-terminal beta domain
MTGWRRLLASGLTVAALGLAVGPGAEPGASVAYEARVPAGAVVLKIGGAATGRAIPAGFLGLSLEYTALGAYAGTNPSAIDPVFLQLIRNLTPGQAPVLRIGGDSTDWTWWPVPGMRRPAGVEYTLTSGQIEVLHTLAATLGARLILGVNLEADSTRVAVAEARALAAGVGRGQVEGLELGNEPELYAVFDWDGSARKGRARGYDFSDFNRDVTRIGRALTMAPLAGPAIGAPGWFPNLGQFLSSHPRVVVATLHRYPLQLCYVHPREPNYPTIAHLLSARASHGLADSVAADVKVAHARGVPLRIDEMNTISCGEDPAVSRSFASALWALDALFEMARVGVNGVNIHSYPGATYELFTFSRRNAMWRAVVEPEYYGLLLFAQAAPAGSRLENVSVADAGQVKAWATRAADGTLRVVAINDGGGVRTIAVQTSSASRAGTLERLQAPGLSSRAGVTLGGQSFGASTSTGVLAGQQRAASVGSEGGQYVFRLPAGSAAMLTVAAAP